MATLIKKVVTRPMPSNATIVTRKGDQIAQWKDRRGKKRTAEVTTGKGGTPRIKTEAATWTAKYRDGEGVVREVATGCRDKQAAASVSERLADASRTGQGKGSVARSRPNRRSPEHAVVRSYRRLRRSSTRAFVHPRPSQDDRDTADGVGRRVAGFDGFRT